MIYFSAHDAELLCAFSVTNDQLCILVVIKFSISFDIFKQEIFVFENGINYPRNSHRVYMYKVINRVTHAAVNKTKPQWCRFVCVDFHTIYKIRSTPFSIRLSRYANFITFYNARKHNARQKVLSFLYLSVGGVCGDEIVRNIFARFMHEIKKFTSILIFSVRIRLHIAAVMCVTSAMNNSLIVSIAHKE